MENGKLYNHYILVYDNDVPDAFLESLASVIESDDKVASIEKREHTKSRLSLSICLSQSKKTNTVRVEFDNKGAIAFVNVSSLAEGKKDNVELLELIDAAIKSDHTSKCVVTTYDSISEYYCDKIYPKLATFERLLRELLFKVYITRFGKEYYEDAEFAKEVAEKAKQDIGERSSGKTDRKRRYPQEFFYSSDLSDIQKVLFERTWTKEDEERHRSYLDGHPDLSLLSDSEIRAFIVENKPKSDWERYFCKIINDQQIENHLNRI